MSSSPSVLGPAGGLGRLNDVLHPTGRHGRKPAQGSTMVRGRRRRGGPAAASCLCASRELPCADVPAPGGLGVGPWATRPLLQSGSSLRSSRQKQGSAKRNALGVRDQESSLVAACPRASRAARRAASRASRPTCRALGGLEAGARQVAHRVYEYVPSSRSRLGGSGWMYKRCTLRAGSPLNGRPLCCLSYRMRWVASEEEEEEE